MSGPVAAVVVAADSDRREVALELTYLAVIGDIFAIQPDIQYVINSGLAPGRRNALVLGLRFTVGREWEG